MHTSTQFRTRLLLALLCAVLALLPLAPVSHVAEAGDCSSAIVTCVEKAFGIDLEVEKVNPGITLAFISRLVIYWWDGDCEYRQVVFVTVSDAQALEAIMTPLGANKWNAMGEVERADYQQALANGVVHELGTEPPVLEKCKTNSLPPCELPWGPIVFDPVLWPDEDIRLYAGLEPVTNPKFCFSFDLEGPRILEPLGDKVMVPFFFVAADDVKRVGELLPSK